MPAILGNKRRGFTFRLGTIETAAAVTANDDREPLERRLDAAEVAGSIDAPANYKQGLDTRLVNLENVVW